MEHFNLHNDDEIMKIARTRYEDAYEGGGIIGWTIDMFRGFFGRILSAFALVDDGSLQRKSPHRERALRR